MTGSGLSSLGGDWNGTPRTPGGTMDPVKRFKQVAEGVLREYFVSMDVGEVAAQLSELETVSGGGMMAVFVKRAVRMALDQGHRERELVALLMSALTPALITTQDILAGFSLLLDDAQDLSLDIPDAADQLTLFTARAIVDEIIAPSQVTQMETHASCSLGGEICASALNLVRARHSTERILVAWGGGDAGTVRHSKDRMQAILEEFSSTHSVDEAASCLHALKVPYFHHEFVKKALTMGIENPVEEDSIIDLLSQLYGMGHLVVQHIQTGFSRMREYVEDLELDVPGASNRLQILEEKSIAIGFLSADDATNVNVVVER